MTNTLLSLTDLGKFQTKDPQFFLDGVASTITDYCGWHIAPSLARTNVPAKIGNDGIIMLPSLYITSVQAVRIYGNVIDASAYTVHPHGWLTLHGLGATGFRNPRNVPVSVDFTHGHTHTPNAVAEVGYELTATVLEKASGVVTDMTRGPTRLTFKEFGVVLSDSQQERLSPFRLRRV